MTITEASDRAGLAAGLMTPEAVRERAADIYRSGLDARLDHFTIDRTRLPATADFVADIIRDRYPGLAIPYHARWRHFEVRGQDRAAAMLEGLQPGTPQRARARFDLVIPSVLLDAGAGDRWRYRDAATGRDIARSEGLAIASLDAFAVGRFSGDPDTPLRTDADALSRLTESDLARAFQVSDLNPLEGIGGRTELLNALGAAAATDPAHFGTPGRIGNLFDALVLRAENGMLEARDILVTVLAALGPIWPGRLELDGTNLGDTWRHPAVRRDDATDGLVPFHKLSQWLSYSLVEPLQEAGIEIAHLDRLTPLAEYRNGGLLIDCGVLALRDSAAAARRHAPGDELIVEWRALTVALIDELAHHVRENLGLSARDLPLASVLEGGTWAAGRAIARELREDGGPPLTIASDGSVF